MDNFKILITDDSFITRRKLKSFITLPNLEIEEAVDGKDAIEKITHGKYDLLLLDLLMPEIDGFHVLEYLQNNKIDLPTIVLSADIQDTSKAKVFALGAKEFLNKPPKVEELNSAISKLLNL